MPDVFITLEEAAAFEGITYEAMKKRVQRSPEQHNVKSQAREGGGKDQVLISTSSLSAKARKAWRAVQKVEGSEVIIDKRAQEAVPWYVTADLNQYTEANKKRFYEAVELAARVQDFIDYDGPDRTGYAERYALGLGISPQSLYRYMKNVLEANAWALKLEKEDGKSRDYFRALALCRKPKETGTFPSLTDEQKAIIENIWFDKRFAANLGTIEMLYERFELEAERREWEEYPSIKTVARYIKFLMGQRGAESARFLAANGTREWKNKRMMKGKRDATSLQVMEYVVGDEHTFDFWVQWTAPNGKIKAVRPKLVAWLDSSRRPSHTRCPTDPRYSGTAYRGRRVSFHPPPFPQTNRCEDCHNRRDQHTQHFQLRDCQKAAHRCPSSYDHRRRHNPPRMRNRQHSAQQSRCQQHAAQQDC